MLISNEFKNRGEQLRFLEKKYKTNRFECVIIYGRRRIGKTELIKKFIADKEHIYHLITQEEKSIQLKRMVNSVYSKFGDIEPKIDDFYDFFKYFSKVVNQKIVFILDEFPYLVEQDKSIPSLFQSFIDEYLSKKDIFLILCGSSISMMKSMLSNDSPLYGRRTGQMGLNAFDFMETRNILTEKNIKEQIELYSVFGGTPFYLQMVDQNLSLSENIVEKICNDKEVLHEEPWMLLKQEFKRPHRYMSILEAVADGYNTPKKIADHISIPQQSAPKYLGELERIRLLKHILPVTDRKKRSRKGLYKLSDSFFDFWFKFIALNVSDAEENPVDFVENTVMREIDTYMGRKFEDICIEFIRKMSKENKLSSKYPQVGHWWYKENEIDIVALNQRENKILFAECKWSRNKVDISLLYELEHKKEKVRWGGKSRGEYFALFSKKGFTKNLLQEAEKRKDLILYDLEKIDSTLKNNLNVENKT